MLFTNTVIKPFQQAILDCFDEILKINYGDDYILGIQQLNLYSDDAEVVDVVTGQESEVGEDNLLEAQIERADRLNEPNINQAGQEQPIN